MDWFNRERLTIYPWIIICLYILITGYWILTGSGLTDRMGKPIGPDFLPFWAASSLVLAGEPYAVYDYPRLQSAEEAVVKTQFVQPFFYPPTFLLMIMPLSLLPYLASFGLWMAITLCLYLVIIRQIAPHPLTIWLGLAFPATYQNFIYGQNGLLSAAFIGSGLILIDHNPFLGGLCLGLLSYKPHLTPLIPIALIASRNWKALAGAATSTVALILVSVSVLGYGTWEVFWRNIPLALNIITTNTEVQGKMATVFTAALLAGFSVPIATLFQAVIAFGVVGTVAWVWFKKAPLAIRGSVLVLGILLFTPYASLYDLVILALPLAWLGWEGVNRGWMPADQSILLLGWIAPIIYPVISKFIGLQIAPLILATLLYSTLRRYNRYSIVMPE
jgi:hypothetical protein